MGMVCIRSTHMRGRYCLQASTIAIRYSCVRKQGFKASKSANAKSSGENAIIDYKMQQYRLFKALGAAYLMLWTGKNIRETLANVVDGVARGDDKVCRYTKVKKWHTPPLTK